MRDNLSRPQAICGKMRMSSVLSKRLEGTEERSCRPDFKGSCQAASQIHAPHRGHAPASRPGIRAAASLPQNGHLHLGPMWEFTKLMSLTPRRNVKIQQDEVQF